MPDISRARGARWLRARELRLPLVVIALLALIVLCGPLAWRRDALKTSLSESLQPPSLSHPMGTDGSGRDVLARFISGARVSLLSGVAVVLLSGLSGGLLGLIAALVRGIADTAIMRLLDMLLAFPQLILAMAVSIAMGPGLFSAVAGIALGCVPVYARLVRSEAIQIQNLQFVAAARTLGLPLFRIAARHIIPSMAPTILVQSAAVFGSTIISLSALGFVGLGAQIPTPEWGTMISEGMSYALSGGWWISFWPGLGLFTAVVGANLLTDAASSSISGRKGEG